MVAFVCDDPKLERALRRLEKEFVSAGGWLSENLTVHCREGRLSLRSVAPGARPPAPGADDLLAAMPRAATIPLDLFRLAPSGDALTVSKNAVKAAPPQRALAEAMVEIYNLTGKISSHLKASPALFAFERKDIFDALFSGRVDLRPAESQKFFFSPENRSELVLGTFHQTRAIGLDGEAFVVAPFMDFANYHPFAHGPVIGALRKPDDALSLVNSKPRENSDECFIRYGIYDAYDAYLGFYYVEREATFVRSVPMVLDLGGVGKIEVRAVGEANHAKNEVAANAARPFEPTVNLLQEGLLEVSSLIIPPSAYPRGLRGTLGNLIGKLNPGLDAKTKDELSAKAARQVLETNIAFYRALSARVDGFLGQLPGEPRLAMAKEMAAFQIGLLTDYARKAAG